MPSIFARIGSALRTSETGSLLPSAVSVTAPLSKAKRTPISRQVNLPKPETPPWPSLTSKWALIFSTRSAAAPVGTMIVPPRTCTALTGTPLTSPARNDCGAAPGSPASARVILGRLSASASILTWPSSSSARSIEILASLTVIDSIMGRRLLPLSSSPAVTETSGK